MSEETILLSNDPKLRGQQLRELRERKGWTQNELAARAGVAEKTVQRLEAGYVGYGAGPTYGNLIKVSLALGQEVTLHLNPLDTPAGILVTTESEGHDDGRQQEPVYPE